MECRELISADRVLCRESLRDFVEHAWHVAEPSVPFVAGWHIDAMCEHLEADFDLLINVPPGLSKSRVVDIFYPVWRWIRDPARKAILASYDDSLMVDLSTRAYELVTSPWFQARWPEVQIAGRQIAYGDYETTAGGARFSTSIGGRLTGRHFDEAIVDDPHKPLAISRTTLEVVERWWRGTLPTRFRDQKKARRVVIMQRLHSKDLSGIILEEGGFEHLRLPMRFEPKACSYTRIGGDPRSDEGELLCPERFPEHVVAALEKRLGPIESAAQLQQRPAPEGGVIIKPSWLEGTFTDLPMKAHVILSVDATFKESGESFVAIHAWARHGGRFYLIDRVHRRMGFVDTLATVKAMRARHRAREVLIEDKANGPAIVDTMKKAVPGVITVEPQGGKYARLSAVSGLFEAGDVLLPATAPWLGEYRLELSTFPQAEHDDDVDATSQALTWLREREGTADLLAKIKLAREAAASKN